MFCPNCGNKIDEGNVFCSSCGHRVNQEMKAESGTEPDKKLYKYSWFMIWATLPVILLLRLICQEEGVGYGWRAYTYYYVPDTMKVVLVLITLFILGTALYLKTKSGVSENRKNVKVAIVSILIFISSMILIMTEW